MIMLEGLNNNVKSLNMALHMILQNKTYDTCLFKKIFNLGIMLWLISQKKKVIC